MKQSPDRLIQTWLTNAVNVALEWYEEEEPGN